MYEQRTSRGALAVAATIVVLSVTNLATDAVRAEMVLSLSGETNLTIEPAVVNDPDDFLPIQGQSLVVWAEIINVGDDVVEVTGPSGASSPTSGGSLWYEFPRTLWDPSAALDDPLETTPLGYPGLRLDPHESFLVPVLEIWGVDLLSGSPPLFSATIGTQVTFDDLRLGFWEGFDRDPNDVNEQIDVVVPLDESFTVTVVPEPSSLCLIVLGVVSLLSAMWSPQTCFVVSVTVG